MPHVNIMRTSELTGVRRRYRIEISMAEYQQGMADWQDGEDIATAFPQLNANQRQWLMDGTTPDEWDEHLNHRWNDHCYD